MTYAKTGEFGIPWEQVRNRALENPSQALAYLKLTEELQPELMADALGEVLEACPQAAGVAIPLYTRLLKASDLERLAARYPEAAQYITQYHDVLTLLLSA